MCVYFFLGGGVGGILKQCPVFKQCYREQDSTVSHQSASLEEEGALSSLL